MWLLEAETFNKMQAVLNNGLKPTQAQISEHLKKFECSTGELPYVSSVSNGTGQINIEGVLTKKPDFWAVLFGGGNATYNDIISSIEIFNNDDSVSEIVLNIDSPGGNVDGMFEAMYAIRDSKKPVKAVVSGLGASAAYGLASQADKILATNDGVFLGSVGTAASFFIDDDVVTITSTNAPNKRPDVKTQEGVAVVREELDAIADLFVEAIAQGRNTTESNVNANFGRGGTFLASEALKRGMIDGISANDNKDRTLNLNVNSKDKVESMDLKTLQLNHTELYDQVRKEAIAEERDRVEAHLTMGEASGAMKTAIEAIKGGQNMTQALTAQYMQAAMNKNDVEKRQKDEQDLNALNNLDNVEANINTETVKPDTDPKEEEGDKVAALVLKRMYGK